MDRNDALFTVHLGDFNTPDETNCSRDHFESVADILKMGPLPTFALSGDNDYLDCPSRSKAWNQYLDIFVGLEDEWDHDIDVNRFTQGSSSRPGGRELFAFYEQGILFVSTVVMNGDGFGNRAEVSKDWIQGNLVEYKDDDDFRGVIIFSHAERSSNVESFLEDVKAVFEDKEVDVPVLYLCGDRHRFQTVGGYAGWGQLDYVSVDKGGCANPILVEVADPGDSLSGSNVFGNGLFRINRRGGRYDSGACG